MNQIKLTEGGNYGNGTGWGGFFYRCHVYQLAAEQLKGHFKDRTWFKRREWRLSMVVLANAKIV